MVTATLLPATCMALALPVLQGVPAEAASGIRWAKIADDGHAHVDFPTEPDPALIDLAFPFCATDRMPCDEGELAWAQLRISVDAYSVQRNDPHDSIARILEVTRVDLVPLVDAFSDHFTVSGMTSDIQRLAFVQGFVKAINYRQDLETGWTEYPKFGLEFLVDEQGDCDDAAILTTLLLDSLEYESYFVHWRGRESGHLSSAVDRGRGDLLEQALPAGSRWVPAPGGGKQLLLVDGTGSTQGCGPGRICGGLGYNEWDDERYGLTFDFAISPNDPALETKLPLSAWNNGGLDRPDRKFDDDRRSSREGIQAEETFDAEARAERLRRRLERFGLRKEQAAVYLRRRYPISRAVYIAVVTGSFLLFVALVARSLYRWRGSRERVRFLRIKRGKDHF